VGIQNVGSLGRHSERSRGIPLLPEFSRDEFFDLFKRFELIISEKSHQDSEIDKVVDFRNLTSADS